MPPPVPRAPAGPSRARARLVGALVAAPTGTVLALAAWLRPAGAGIGTHEQLGLPECGWIRTMDLPCPTCGMTTAFANAADGRMLASIGAQPLGFALALAAAAAFVGGAWTTITGSRAYARLGAGWPARTGWILAGAVVAAWTWKVLTHRGLI